MKGYGIYFTGDFVFMTIRCRMDKLLAEITKLIDGLNSLHEGDHAVDLVVARGKSTIPYLRKYLMEGQPSHIYQPRQRAVNALARLGAKEVLIEYLSAPKDIPDPVFRFGEEAVENTAARALAGWLTDDVFEVLLKIADTRTLPGVIEALGLFRRQELVSVFIAALMDDVSRTAAENALKSMGEIAKPALIEAARMPNPPDDYESPSNLLQRRSAMKILAALNITEDDWPRLKELLRDDDPEISITTTAIALEVADREDRSRAIETLIEKIPHASWHIQADIEDCLVKHYRAAQTEISSKIVQLKMQTEKSQASDRILQLLLNVRRLARRSGVNGDQ